MKSLSTRDRTFYLRNKVSSLLTSAAIFTFAEVPSAKDKMVLIFTGTENPRLKHGKVASHCKSHNLHLTGSLIEGIIAASEELYGLLCLPNPMFDHGTTHAVCFHSKIAE